jgi:para-nitrobenzyl esterase
MPGTTTIETTTGPVRPRPPDAYGVRAALGVPYALPPFGGRRFAAPEPVPGWRGVRDATRFGPISPQSARLPGAPVWEPGAPGGEDVLTVNVWWPGGPGPRPVLVWLHGGAYTFGSPGQPDHDGAALAREGLVVVVPGYRVGFEGFAPVPGAPDNRGLLDQAAALRWVRANAAAFGGDPANVTLAGQSAGAGAAACLLASGAARGLVRRAVLHSPPDAHPPRPVAVRLARAVAAEAGVEWTARALRAAPPGAFTAAGDAVAARFAADPASGPLHEDPVLYGPVVAAPLPATGAPDAGAPGDGSVAAGGTLAADPLTAGLPPDVDLLCCATVREAWLFARTGALIPARDRARVHAYARALGLPARLADAYLAAAPDGDPAHAHLSLAGDAVFAVYAERLAAAHARAGGRAYLSRFARTRAAALPWHAADVPFAFGTLDSPATHFLTGGPPDAADHALSARMRRAWASFCATGAPGWAALDASGAGEVRAWAVPADATVPAPGPERAPWHGARATRYR